VGWCASLTCLVPANEPGNGLFSDVVHPTELPLFRLEQSAQPSGVLGYVCDSVVRATSLSSHIGNGRSQGPIIDATIGGDINTHTIHVKQTENNGCT